MANGDDEYEGLEDGDEFKEDDALQLLIDNPDYTEALHELLVTHTAAIRDNRFDIGLLSPVQATELDFVRAACGHLILAFAAKFGPV
jgi:hypothetical protein